MGSGVSTSTALILGDAQLWGQQVPRGHTPPLHSSAAVRKGCGLSSLP